MVSESMVVDSRSNGRLTLSFHRVDPKNARKVRIQKRLATIRSAFEYYVRLFDDPRIVQILISNGLGEGNESNPLLRSPIVSKEPYRFTVEAEVLLNHHRILRISMVLIGYQKLDGQQQSCIATSVVNAFHTQLQGRPLKPTRRNISNRTRELVQQQLETKLGSGGLKWIESLTLETSLDHGRKRF